MYLLTHSPPSSRLIGRRECNDRLLHEKIDGLQTDGCFVPRRLNAMTKMITLVMKTYTAPWEKKTDSLVDCGCTCVMGIWTRTRLGGMLILPAVVWT